MNWHRLAFSLLALGVAVAALVESFSFGFVARRFPLVVSVTLVVLSVAVVVEDLASRDDSDDEIMDSGATDMSLSEMAVIFGWIGGCLGLMWLVGFVIASPVFVAAFLFFRAKIGAVAALASGAGVAGFIQFASVVWYMQFPPGHIQLIGG